MDNRCCRWWAKNRPRGFRLWPSDILILLIGLAAAGVLIGSYPILSHIIFIVIGHFFLFCNVFRVGRVPEYCWAVWFIASVTGLVAWDLYSPWRLLVSVLPATGCVIGYAVTRKDYHGAFCGMKQASDHGAPK